MSSRWSDSLQEHRARQEDRILSSALQLLRERGIAGLTMSLLAERAGISRATLYHHYPDIDAVLAAWVAKEIDRTLSALIDDAQAIADPMERLTYLVEAQTRAFASQDHRLGAEHFESEASPPAVRREVAARMAPLRQILAQTIAEAKIVEVFRADLDPVLGADLILGLLGAVRRRLVEGSLDESRAATEIVQLIRAGWEDQAASPEPRSTAGGD